MPTRSTRSPAIPSCRSLLQARSRRGRATVITPHPLEAARLLGCAAAAVQADRLAASRELVARFGCVVALKGSGTVTAGPGQVPRINPTGNARLATAGTGDVLAGLIAARLARRLSRLRCRGRSGLRPWPGGGPLAGRARAHRFRSGSRDRMAGDGPDPN